MAPNIKRAALVGVTCASLCIGGALTGAGLAAADPGPSPCGPQQCNVPGDYDHRGPDHGRGDDWGRDRDWGRGIDQGRFDHQPFNYNGQWVTPVFRPELPQPQWGFWLFGVWIPL